MSDLASRLSDYSVFASLAPKVVAEVAECVTEVRFDEFEQVFTAGKDADSFYLIEQGRVAISVQPPNGDPVTISTLGPGHVLGVSWILPPHRLTFDATTLAPTDALMIDARRLREKCEHDSELGFALYARFAGLIRDRLVATRLRLLDLYGNTGSS